MNEFIACFKKYAVFEGRARRREYWMFYLFYIIFIIVLGILNSIIGFRTGILGTIAVSSFVLIAIIPSISVSVRRLHDINKSGWMIFISLIPIVGAIWLFVLMVTEGTKGDNQYGPDPKIIIQTPDQVVNNTSI